MNNLQEKMGMWRKARAMADKLEEEIVQEAQQMMDAGTTQPGDTIVWDGAQLTYTADTAKIGRPKLATAATLADLLDEYLASLPDEWEVITMLVAAKAQPAVAAALAEQAELPAHKPATLTVALATVLDRRSFAVYLPRQAALRLVLLLSASDDDEPDSLQSLIKPQLNMG